MLQFSLEATLGFHPDHSQMLSRELRNYVDRCAAFLGMSSVELVVLYVVQKFGEANRFGYCPGLNLWWRTLPRH